MLRHAITMTMALRDIRQLKMRLRYALIALHAALCQNIDVLPAMVFFFLPYA